jgi:hypothetical protein
VEHVESGPLQSIFVECRSFMAALQSVDATHVMSKPYISQWRRPHTSVEYGVVLQWRAATVQPLLRNGASGEVSCDIIMMKKRLGTVTNIS